MPPAETDSWNECFTIKNEWLVDFISKIMRIYISSLKGRVRIQDVKNVRTYSTAPSESNPNRHNT